MKTRLLTIFAIAILAFSANAQDDYLQFDGINSQRVKYTTSFGDVLDNTLNGATDYTIEVWVKPTSNEIHNKVIMKRWNQFAVTLYENDNKRFYFTHYDPSGGTGSTYVNTLNDVITIGEWNHLAVICNSVDNTIKLYVNGVDVTDDTDTAADVVLEAFPLDANLYLGYGGSDTYFTGDMDKVRIKNTAEDIANLNTTNVAGTDYTADANTAVLYNFSEGSGDLTANEADGLDAELLCVSEVCDASIIWWGTHVLSSQDFNTTNFKLFPNPVENSTFFIQTINNEILKNVEIFDLLGRVVNKIELSDNTQYTSVDVSGLNAGLYIVKINTNSGIGTQKLMIK